MKKVQIGQHILMVVIAEIQSKDGETTLDIGQLDMMVDEFKLNFTAIDAHIGEMNNQQEAY